MVFVGKRAMIENFDKDVRFENIEDEEIKRLGVKAKEAFDTSPEKSLSLIIEIAKKLSKKIICFCGLDTIEEYKHLSERDSLYGYVMLFQLNGFIGESNHFVNLLSVISNSEKFLSIGRCERKEKIGNELLSLEYLSFVWDQVEKVLKENYGEDIGNFPPGAEQVKNLTAKRILSKRFFIPDSILPR